MVSLRCLYPPYLRPGRRLCRCYQLPGRRCRHHRFVVACSPGAPGYHLWLRALGGHPRGRKRRSYGLYDDAGIFLGRHDRRYLRHDGPEHVMAFAPTRSGKSVGLVVPTLLGWTGSAVIHDIKGENWELTAGWRSKFSHCLLFNPTDSRSARYNPLLEFAAVRPRSAMSRTSPTSWWIRVSLRKATQRSYSRGVFPLVSLHATAAKFIVGKLAKGRGRPMCHYQPQFCVMCR